VKTSGVTVAKLVGSTGPRRVPTNTLQIVKGTKVSKQSFF
jgi:hypothetical protein